MNMGYLMIVFSMLLWGSVGIFVRKINQPPEVIVFFRVLLAFIVMGVCGAVRRSDKKDDKHSISKKEYILLIASGVFIALNWHFFFSALKNTTIASATLSYYMAPVIVTILSVVLLNEKINFITVIAVILSFTGVMLMTLKGGQASGNFKLSGVIYGLIAAFFYALVTISVKKLEKISSFKIIMFQMGVSSILFLPSIRNLNKIDIVSVVFLLIIGIVHTAFALQLYFEGIKRIKVQHVGVLSYIDPLSAVLMAALFLNEIPNLITVVGGGFILISTYLITTK